MPPSITKYADFQAALAGTKARFDAQIDRLREKLSAAPSAEAADAVVAEAEALTAEVHTAYEGLLAEYNGTAPPRRPN